MKKFSALNRCLDEQKSSAAKLDKWASVLLKNDALDVVLCGHDHVPRTRNYADGMYINTGSFCTHRTLAAYNNGSFTLVKWNAAGKKITPYSTLNDNS
jgi:predicted phosphodiesterase